MAGSLLPAPCFLFDWLGITILVYHHHSCCLTSCHRCCRQQLLAVADNSCLHYDILFNGSTAGRLSSSPPAVPNICHCQR
eukprot:4341302-Ditylum_brightwellii.AAC.1